MKEFQFNPKLVLIGGGSASGKSTITNSLKEKYFKNEAVVINYDDYYKSQDNLTMEERQKTNYDIPAALDNDLLLLHLKKLLKNEEVNKPIYDYSLHNRKKETEIIKPCSLIILEGIFALYDERIRRLSSFSIFVDAPSLKRMERKIERDVNYRGRKKEYAAFQFKNVTEPMHLLYVEPTKKYADVIISGYDNPDKSVSIVAKLIKEKIFKSLE